MYRILIVDDEPKIVRLLTEQLQDAGYLVESASSVGRARELLEGTLFDLLVTDIRLPDGSGIDLLRHARQASSSTRVVCITAYGRISDAVQAIRLGGFDYLEKPFDMAAFGHVVERALQTTRLEEELRVERAHARRDAEQRRLVARSPAMQRVKLLLDKAAPTPTTVLLEGESGTGKEIVAETLHALSPGAARPMIRVNCLAIPTELMESELFGHVRGAFTGAHTTRKGWFELAHGSTLFLDEIADLPLALQGKLLRALEERRITRVGGAREIPVSLRLVAASNASLRQRVEQGRFREDLFYRLNVFPIALPPLRERREDLPELVQDLLVRIARRLGRRGVQLEPDFMDALTSYRWPGNVRELRNVLERAAVLAGDEPLSPAHLPLEVLDASPPQPSGGDPPGDDALDAGGGAAFSEQVEAFQRRLLLDTLRACGWVKKDAAVRLGLSARALSYHIRRLDLEARRQDPIS